MGRAAEEEDDGENGELRREERGPAARLAFGLKGSGGSCRWFGPGERRWGGPDEERRRQDEKGSSDGDRHHRASPAIGLDENGRERGEDHRSNTDADRDQRDCEAAMLVEPGQGRRCDWGAEQADGRAEQTSKG